MLQHFTDVFQQKTFYFSTWLKGYSMILTSFLNNTNKLTPISRHKTNKVFWKILKTSLFFFQKVDSDFVLTSYIAYALQTSCVPLRHVYVCWTWFARRKLCKQHLHRLLNLRKRNMREGRCWYIVHHSQHFVFYIFLCATLLKLLESLSSEINFSF